jgi:hypothetical protein
MGLAGELINYMALEKVLVPFLAQKCFCSPFDTRSNFSFPIRPSVTISINNQASALLNDIFAHVGPTIFLFFLICSTPRGLLVAAAGGGGRLFLRTPAGSIIHSSGTARPR